MQLYGTRLLLGNHEVEIAHSDLLPEDIVPEQRLVPIPITPEHGRLTLQSTVFVEQVFTLLRCKIVTS